MVYTLTFDTNSAALCGDRVIFIFQSACARQLAPPQTHKYKGRGSFFSSAVMIQSEPSESLPGPTAAIPNPEYPAFTICDKYFSSGNPFSCNIRLFRTLPY